METIESITLMLGAAWASGINLYATILVLSWMSGAGHIDLPPDLQVINSPVVLLAAGGMYCVEFFADKIPGLGYRLGCFAHLYPDTDRGYASRRCGEWCSGSPSNRASCPNPRWWHNRCQPYTKASARA